MNDYEVFLDELIEEHIVRLAYHATEVQTRIDSYITLQSRTITGAELESLITSESTTVKAEIDAMKRFILQGIRESVTQSAQTSLETSLVKASPEDQLYDWEAEPKACPDCSQRASQGAFTMAYWLGVGTPRTGATICGRKCRCRLVPVK